MGALPADLRKLGPKGPFLLAISRDIIAHLHGSVSAQTPRIVTIKVVAFLLVSSVYTWWHHVRACTLVISTPPHLSGPASWEVFWSLRRDLSV